MDEITGDEEVDLYAFAVKASKTGTPLIETEDEMGTKKTYTPGNLDSDASHFARGNQLDGLKESITSTFLKLTSI